MSRTEARELFMQLLFQMEAQNDYGEHHKTKFFDGKIIPKKQTDYIDKMGDLVIAHLTEIDHFIEVCSDKWKIDRLCKVDLAVMRTAIIEILYMEDIPDSVAVNEAVEIAKKYGTENSGRFVNGVLGQVVKIKNAD